MELVVVYASPSDGDNSYHFTPFNSLGKQNAKCGVNKNRVLEMITEIAWNFS